MHNENEILMGTTNSTDKWIEDFDADPADFPAGTAVRLASDGSVSKTSGELLGVSLGASLSKTKRLSVARAGSGIPLLLTENFEPAPNDPVFIDTVTGLGQAEPEGEDPHAVIATAAIYRSSPKTAIKEDGTEVESGVAYIDMVGGL